MSKNSRQELIALNRAEYRGATRQKKSEILNQLESSTGHNRKYLMQQLNGDGSVSVSKRNRKPKYDEKVLHALKQLWYLSNNICMKRLIPFIPELLTSLEKHQSMPLEAEVKAKLLTISVATADRLLKEERTRHQRNPTLTKQGNILRKHIEVRTFAEWQDKRPGFVEVDTVGHHGGRTSGDFLYTLSLTDVATGWTEGIPIFRKTEHEALAGICELRSRLPFPLLGLDCDNGGEFMNEELIGYCDAEELTLTRSREYRSNDQCFIEEKNGSVIRKLTGHGRYEGSETFKVLMQLYEVASKYVNFFQPSLKLKTKTRTGAKVHRTYESAQTPFQRLLMMPEIPKRVKTRLTKEFESLNLVSLFEELTMLQQKLAQLRKYRKAPAGKSIETTVVPLNSLKPVREEMIRRIVSCRADKVWSQKDLFKDIPRQNTQRVLRQCLQHGLIEKISHGRYQRVAQAPGFACLSDDNRYGGTTSAVRNHFLARVHKDVLIVDLLQYGCEATVRTAINRLRKAGFIKRTGKNQYRRTVTKTNIKAYKPAPRAASAAR